jgi:hypothetical protein
MVRAPQLVALLAQRFLVEFADLFEDLPHALEVLQLAAHVRDLFGMESDLAVLGAGIVDVENPLEMALAAGASGAGDRGGVEGMAFEERATQERIKRRKKGEEFGSPRRRLLPFFG